MDIFTLYNQESLDSILQKLEMCRKHIGVAINYDKTALYRIGSLQKTQARLYTQEDIKWTNGPINVLGVEITAEDQAITSNFEAVVQKVEGILKTWSSRNLSLIGKVNIINTLVASLFVYKMTVLPNLGEKYIKWLESKFREFIWCGKKSKISLSTLQKSKKEVVSS